MLGHHKCSVADCYAMQISVKFLIAQTSVTYFLLNLLSKTKVKWEGKSSAILKELIGRFLVLIFLFYFLKKATWQARAPKGKFGLFL